MRVYLSFVKLFDSKEKVDCPIFLNIRGVFLTNFQFFLFLFICQLILKIQFFQRQLSLIDMKKVVNDFFLFNRGIILSFHLNFH